MDKTDQQWADALASSGGVGAMDLMSSYLATKGKGWKSWRTRIVPLAKEKLSQARQEHAHAMGCISWADLKAG